MIEGLINSATTRIQTTFHSWTKKEKIILAIAGLAALISLPFLLMAFRRRRDVSADGIDDKDAQNKANSVGVSGVTGKTAEGDFKPFQVGLRISNSSVPLDIQVKDETVLSFVKRAVQEAAQREPQFSDASYFDEVYLICNGEVINTPAMEHFSMAELNQKYQLGKTTSQMHLVLHPRDSRFFQECSATLNVFQGKFQPALSCTIDEDPRKTVIQFREGLHDFCKKVSQASQGEETVHSLALLISCFITVIQSTFDGDVKEYFQTLLKSVANIDAQFIEHSNGLADALLQRSYLLPLPKKVPLSDQKFTVTIQNAPSGFKSSEELRTHCKLFDLMMEFPQSYDVSISSNSLVVKSVPSNLGLAAINNALFFLQGGNVGDYLSRAPFDLQRAASFLQIPYLQLICERQLILDLSEGRLQRSAIPKDTGSMKLEMPHFYRALELNGWLAS